MGTKSTMSGEEDCVVCGVKVRQRQEALSCDDCRRWQHRTCNSGISRETYRQINKGQLDIEWYCQNCQRIDTEPEPVCPEEAPNHVSTSDSESDHVQIHVKEFGDFNLEMNYTIPNAIEHLTLRDDHIEQGIEPVQFNLTFKIVQTATRKCKDALVDSAGYSYNVKVLQAVLELLPRRATVQTAFADFEAALWKSLRETIPGIVIRGCNFHWTQAVWRQVQNLGLQTHYCEKGSVYKFVRLLMALPFIPVEHVQPTFQQISQRAQDSNSDVLHRLIRYFENRYVANPKLPIAVWNIFMCAIRTNNDCEGWHRRLNSVARNGSPPFYVI